MSGHQVESSCTSPTPLRAKERTFFYQGWPLLCPAPWSPNTEQKEVAGAGQNCSTCRLFRADYSELKEHANSRMMPSDSSLYLCDQV
uniref:Uncharacterized protein n=1 Tax=Oryza rufipogon TaxID=4529 RepID=A0A0E0P965_ORYRU